MRKIESNYRFSAPWREGQESNLLKNGVTDRRRTVWLPTQFCCPLFGRNHCDSLVAVIPLNRYHAAAAGIAVLRLERPGGIQPPSLPYKGNGLALAYRRKLFGGVFPQP